MLKLGNLKILDNLRVSNELTYMYLLVRISEVSLENYRTLSEEIKIITGKIRDARNRSGLAVSKVQIVGRREIERVVVTYSTDETTDRKLVKIYGREDALTDSIELD